MLKVLLCDGLISGKSANMSS